jgi:hypothetical protein
MDNENNEINDVEVTEVTEKQKDHTNLIALIALTAAATVGGLTVTLVQKGVPKAKAFFKGLGKEKITPEEYDKIAEEKKRA